MNVENNENETDVEQSDHPIPQKIVEEAVEREADPSVGYGYDEVEKRLHDALEALEGYYADAPGHHEDSEQFVINDGKVAIADVEMHHRYLAQTDFEIPDGEWGDIIMDGVHYCHEKTASKMGIETGHINGHVYFGGDDL